MCKSQFLTSKGNIVLTKDRRTVYLDFGILKKGDWNLNAVQVTTLSPHPLEAVTEFVRSIQKKVHSRSGFQYFDRVASHNGECPFKKDTDGRSFSTCLRGAIYES